MAEFLVKICGLRDLGAARSAVDAGADLLGFILAPGKRQMSTRAINAIGDELGDGRPPIVGVKVNQTALDIDTAVREANLDLVQLSGDEPVSVLNEIDVPVIKSIRLADHVSIHDAIEQIEPWFSARNPVRHLIVEGHTAGAFGGTGALANWDLCALIAERYPIILAGGLTPENVAAAIAHVRPAGVDVSSGVESFGRKDPEKIAAYVMAARQAVVG